jgi:hypothetical protein
MDGQRGSAVLGSPAVRGRTLLDGILTCGIWDNVPSHLPMKVVVQSSSLLFTLLSIIFNVPITRVKRAPAERDGTRRELRRQPAGVALEEK